MRIAINCKELEEPIGGAHQFTNNLAEFLAIINIMLQEILNQILI